MSQITAPAGPVWDLTGHAQSARSNPVRGLSRDLTGREPGFERAPYGHACDDLTGFLWGVLGKVHLTLLYG